MMCFGLDDSLARRDNYKDVDALGLFFFALPGERGKTGSKAGRPQQLVFALFRSSLCFMKIHPLEDV